MAGLIVELGLAGVLLARRAVGQDSGNGILLLQLTVFKSVSHDVPCQ